MQLNMNGRVALVTGASRGLGAAIARELASCGAKVVVNYFNSSESAEQVVRDIAAKGGRAIALRADVTDEQQVRAMVDEIERKLGPIEIVVNNATGPQPMMSVEQQTWEHHLDQLRFFVKAPLLILHATLPGMKQRRFGRIIHIGSEVVENGNAEFGHYVSAKAAMLGLTRSWAAELGAAGITVNLVAPGWIPVERHADTPEASLQRYVQLVPLKRQGLPQDIANAVAFLASEQGNFITGQKISVNGGKTFA